uniref:Myb-like domain-containing protein n=1 Tax=Panagrolaimus superbus TaxID=310955 RepID=A0A914Z2R9_9BILA
MPSQGILIDGLPFHHCFPYPLKKHHIRRLYAHGIILKTNCFSAGEDAQLIENWKKYAKKNNFEYEEAPIYCGWAKHLGYDLPMSTKKFHRKTKFLPYMCRGLLDRCAIQVYRRCYRIFDPRYDEFGRQQQKEWTEEDDRRLRVYYNHEGPSWQKIAVKLQRNRFQVQTRYQRVICGEKAQQVPVEGKTKLLYIKDDEDLRAVIYEYTKDFLPSHPVALVIKGAGENEDKNINWNRLCKKYSNLTDIKCQSEWTKIKAQLRAAFNRENNPSITFNEVEKIVFGPNHKKFHNLKPKIAQKAFEILHELAKEKEIQEIWEINAAELTSRLKEAEVLFFTSYTLGSHILRTAHKILTTLKNGNLLQILPIETTVIDLIEMLAYFMKKSWKPNEKYAVVDKKVLAQLEALRTADGDSDNAEDQKEDEKESDDEVVENGNDEGEDDQNDVADNENATEEEENGDNQNDEKSDSDSDSDDSI